ncbi:MAG: alpha/beta hydrolase [Cellulomonas sp.]|nr:alpha/beta hydrolase [Cellulomonas sp.]
MSWAPDVLGDRFEQLTLPLADDDEGEVVATLVRPATRPAAPTADVLYVHGWSDYFFQTELADFWAGQGAAFHALDLRKYGRSLRPHQRPGFISDLATYDEDIAAALDVLRTDPARPLILMGHSTGGLTLSLWAARHPDVASGLLLNSPWLEFQTRAIGRVVLTPAMTLGARIDPRHELPNVDLGFYTRAVSASADGEWTYRADWRPARGFRTTRAWLDAVLRGQEQVERGLDLRIPVLVLLSTRSTLLPRWTPEMAHTDTALDVVGVARRSADLGRHVQIERLEGALHDVVLSAAPVREVAYAAMAHWVRTCVVPPTG